MSSTSGTPHLALNGFCPLSLRFSPVFTYHLLFSSLDIHEMCCWLSTRVPYESVIRYMTNPLVSDVVYYVKISWSKDDSLPYPCCSCWNVRQRWKAECDDCCVGGYMLFQTSLHRSVPKGSYVYAW